MKTHKKYGSMGKKNKIIEEEINKKDTCIFVLFLVFVHFKFVCLFVFLVGREVGPKG